MKHSGRLNFVKESLVQTCVCSLRAFFVFLVFRKHTKFPLLDAHFSVESQLLGFCLL